MTPARAPKPPKKLQRRTDADEAKKLPRAKSEPVRRLGVDERRAQLMDLGRRLFLEHPYDALSIDDIAREAGISKGLLYHYFPSKRHFYVATVEDAAAQLLETTKALPDLTPPEQAVRRIDAYLDFVETHAQAFVTLLRSGVGHDPEVTRVVDGTREAFVTSVLDTIGVADRPIYRLAMRGWVGLVEAASLEWAERKLASRAVVQSLLLHTLRATIESARSLDPDAPWKLGP